MAFLRVFTTMSLALAMAITVVRPAEAAVAVPIASCDADCACEYGDSECEGTNQICGKADECECVSANGVGVCQPVQEEIEP